MKKIISVLLLMCFLLSSFAFAESATSQLQEMYAQAELLMATGDYAGAAAKFEAMGAYSDASQMAMYCKAVAAAETLGMYDVAIEAFKNLGDFKDSKQMATYYDGRKNQATADYIIGDDITAVSDVSLEPARTAYHAAAETYAALALFKDCLTRMSECQINEKSIVAEQEIRYVQAGQLMAAEDYASAAVKYEALGSYSDASQLAKHCRYKEALSLEQQRDYDAALMIFKRLNGFKDSKEHEDFCNLHIGLINAIGVDLRKGQAVKSIKWGTGKVLTVSRMGSEFSVIVCFENGANIQFKLPQEYKSGLFTVLDK